MMAKTGHYLAFCMLKRAPAWKKWWLKSTLSRNMIYQATLLVFNSLQLTWFDCLCQYFQRLFCRICEIWPSQYLWQVLIFLNSLPRWQLFKFLGFLCVFCAHYFRLLDVSRQFSIVVGGPSLLLVDSDSDAVMGDFGLTRQLETKNHLQMHQISGQEIHLSRAKKQFFSYYRNTFEVVKKFIISNKRCSFKKFYSDECF